ncbi:Hypothetical_protein [Hexamita inflata]|uniref:Hypothetical_protein n=1 Tax=Hexamita inflata TaxID=28002 RepID=A0ABP1GW79_9EUKA
MITYRHNSDATVRVAFNNGWLEHYLIYLANTLRECTENHVFRQISLSSHPNELYFSKIHLYNCNDNTPQNFKHVSQTLQLQQHLCNNLGYEVKTNRVGTHHTQRCNVTRQLNETEINEMNELANVIFKYMNGDQLDSEIFSKISDFWREVKSGISKEWQQDKLKNRAKKHMIIDGHNTDRAGSYGRILQSSPHVPINSPLCAQYIKEVYLNIALAKEVKRRGLAKLENNGVSTLSQQVVKKRGFIVLYITKIAK